MSAPVPQMNGAPPTMAVDRNTLVNDLGNAASQSAKKGAMASDGGQAKDYGAAALSYVQAIVALITPPKAPQAPQNGSQGSTGPSS